MSLEAEEQSWRAKVYEQTELPGDPAEGRRCKYQICPEDFLQTSWELERLKNILKEKLEAGKQTFGLWMSIPSPDVTESLAQLPFDWFVFDNEHTPLNEMATQNLLMATKGTGVTPLVRVAWNDATLIKRSIDAGPHGIVIPSVSNKQQAKDAVAACKYPPKGTRGFGPRRALYLDPEYVKTANSEVLVIPQIETAEAVRNIDEILTVEGVDIYFIGPFDLSADMGFVGNPAAPEVQKAIDKLFQAGKDHGVYGGIYGGAGMPLGQRVRQGWPFIGVGDDLGFLAAGATQTLKMLGRL